VKYELFYATGGHGGPYEGKAAALEAARRLVGGANGRYIDVVPYSQPWEATAVRDLHLLRGVERVYAAPDDGWYSEEYETLADKKFAERDALLVPGREAVGNALWYWWYDNSDPAKKVSLALQQGKKPPPGDVKKVRRQLQRLADSGPSRAFRGHLKGDAARKELAWIIKELGRI